MVTLFVEGVNKSALNIVSGCVCHLHMHCPWGGKESQPHSFCIFVCTMTNFHFLFHLWCLKCVNGAMWCTRALVVHSFPIELPVLMVLWLVSTWVEGEVVSSEGYPNHGSFKFLEIYVFLLLRPHRKRISTRNPTFQRLKISTPQD